MTDTLEPVQKIETSEFKGVTVLSVSYIVDELSNICLSQIVRELPQTYGYELGTILQ